jgi:hypothetical protein
MLAFGVWITLEAYRTERDVAAIASRSAAVMVMGIMPST